MNLPHRIAGNTVYMLGSHILINLLGMVTTMLMIRALGPAEYGDLTLALAYLGFFTTLAEASLSVTITREASQTPAQLGKLLGNGLVLQGILAISAFVAATAISPFLGYNPAVTRLFQLGLALLLFSPFSLFRLVFLITQEIKLVAVLDIITRLLGFLFTLLIIKAGWAQANAMLWVQIGTTVAATAIYYRYSRQYIPSLSLRLDWPLCRRLIEGSLPLVVTSLLMAAQIHIGRLMVGQILSKSEGGYYAVAARLATSVQFFPAVYFASVYPLLARYHVQDRAKFRWLYRFSYKSLMIIILPVALLASLTRETIILFYAGSAYLDAAPLFAGFIWLRVFQYAGMTFYYVMLAANKQGYFPKVSILRAALQLSMLFLLLPRIGLMGAVAAATVMYLSVFTIYALIKQTRQYIWDWLREMARPLLSVVAVGGILVNLQLSAVAIWIVGLLLYTLFLFISGSVNQQDRKFASDMFLQFVKRARKSS